MKHISLQTLMHAVGCIVAVLLGACLVGMAVRDATVATAILFYLPLLPFGLGAAFLDLLVRGRALPRFRFGLAILGIVAAAASASTLVSWGTPVHARTSGAQDELTVVQWNVQYGGRHHLNDPWRWIAESIKPMEPDIVILNEAPPRGEIAALAKSLGPDWTYAIRQGARNDDYYYSLAVLARGSVRFEKEWPVVNGSAIDVKALVNGRWLHVVVADGVSNPLILRRPFLQSVAKICVDAHSAGGLVDIVAGDFNTIHRSLGFDAIADAGNGYRLAAESTRGWRATFPATFPLYDIDHVWVSSNHSVEECVYFVNRETNHRGQVARIQLGAPPPPAYLRGR